MNNIKLLLITLATFFQFLVPSNITAQSPENRLPKLKQALADTERSGSKVAIAEAAAVLGFAYAQNNNYLEGIATAQKAITLFRELKMPVKEARCYGTLIWAHNAMRNYDRVEEYAQKVLQVGQEQKDTFLLGASLDALGTAYSMKKDHQKALDCHRESLKYMAFLGESLGTVHNSIAVTYKDLGQWEKALEEGKIAIKLGRESEDTLGLVSSLYNMALFQAHFKYYDAAEKLLTEADILTKYLNTPETDRDMYAAKSYFYKMKGDFTKAYVAHQAFHTMDSTLMSQEHHQQFATLEVAYQIKEKERENLALSNQVKQQYLIFGAIILGLLVIGGFIYVQRNRLKKEKEIAQKELDSYTAILMERTSALELLRKKVEIQTNSKEKNEVIAQLLNSSILTEEQWRNFKQKFEHVHEDFFKKLQDTIPEITESEKRLAALTKLDLTGNQIASMLGISPDSVIKTRYRLRKKVEDGKLEGILSKI